MKRMLSGFSAALKKEFGRIEYGTWRWRSRLSWKRFLPLEVVLLVLLVVGVYVLASTASGKCGPDVEYRIIGTTMYISGTGPMENYANVYYVGLEQVIETKRFWKDTPWKAWRYTLTRVIVMDGVTAVGSGAFDGFENLRNVELAGSVVNLGASAFSSCSKLQRVVGKGVNLVGQSAFKNCTNLKRVILEDGGVLPTHFALSAFEGCRNLKYIKMNDSPVFGPASFLDCKSLTRVACKTPMMVGAGAFMGCTALTTFPIESTIGLVGCNAFRNCTSLKNVKLPETMTRLPNGLFQGCTALENVVLPGALTVIGERAFYNCISLQTLDLPESLAEIEKDAFNGAVSLKTLEIPENVQTVNRTAFRNWNAEQTIVYYVSELFSGGLLQSDAVLCCTNKS